LMIEARPTGEGGGMDLIPTDSTLIPDLLTGIDSLRYKHMYAK
jgi:hypothetical protein